MAQALDIQEIVDNLGEYCREFKDNIFQDMYMGLGDNLSKFMTIDPNCTKEQVLLALQVGDLVKPANSDTFSPSNNSVIVGNRFLSPKGWKVDMQLDYQKLWNTWLFHYGTPKKGVPTEQNQVLPFHTYVMAWVMKRVEENIRRALFQGEYDALGTTPLDIVDGVIKIVLDEITAGNLVPVANTNGVGNIRANINKCHEAFGIAYQNQPAVVIMGSRYYRDLITEIGASSTKTLVLDGSGKKNVIIADAVQTVDGYPLTEIIHEPMIPGEAIMVTTKNNLIVGFDAATPSNAIRIQEQHRKLDVMIDGAIAFNFHQTKWLNTNEMPVVVNDKWD
jgi:hypothetical protein